jgi:hypothetical protein
VNTDRNINEKPVKTIKSEIEEKNMNNKPGSSSTANSTANSIATAVKTAPPLSPVSPRLKAKPVPKKHSGYMSRQGSVFRKWQKRYFILEKGELSYYEGETEPGSGVGKGLVGTPLTLRGYVVTEMEEDELFLNMPGRRSTISDHVTAADTLDPLGSDKSLTRQLLVKIEKPQEKLNWEKALNEHIDYISSL